METGKIEKVPATILTSEEKRYGHISDMRPIITLQQEGSNRRTFLYLSQIKDITSEETTSEEELPSYYPFINASGKVIFPEGEEYANKKIAEETTPEEEIQNRLEYLRGEIQAEKISYGEIVELQSLVDHISPDDIELLQWAKGEGE